MSVLSEYKGAQGEVPMLVRALEGMAPASVVMANRGKTCSGWALGLSCLVRVCVCVRNCGFWSCLLLVAVVCVCV